MTEKQSLHRHLTPIIAIDRRLASEGTGDHIRPLARRSLRLAADGTIGQAFSCDHLLAA